MSAGRVSTSTEADLSGCSCWTDIDGLLWQEVNPHLIPCHRLDLPSKYGSCPPFLLPLSLYHPSMHRSLLLLPFLTHSIRLGSSGSPVGPYKRRNSLEVKFLPLDLWAKLWVFDCLYTASNLSHYTSRETVCLCIIRSIHQAGELGSNSPAVVTLIHLSRYGFQCIDADRQLSFTLFIPHFLLSCTNCWLKTSAVCSKLVSHCEYGNVSVSVQAVSVWLVFWWTSDLKHFLSLWCKTQQYSLQLSFANGILSCFVMGIRMKRILGNVSCGGKSPEGLVDVRSHFDNNTVFLDTAWTLNAADLGQLKRIRAYSEYGGTMRPQQLLSLKLVAPCSSVSQGQTAFTAQAASHLIHGILIHPSSIVMKA